MVRAAESVGNVDRYIGIRECEARGQESRKLSGLRHVVCTLQRCLVLVYSRPYHDQVAGDDKYEGDHTLKAPH